MVAEIWTFLFQYSRAGLIALFVASFMHRLPELVKLRDSGYGDAAEASFEFIANPLGGVSDQEVADVIHAASLLLRESNWIANKPLADVVAIIDLIVKGVMDSHPPENAQTYLASASTSYESLQTLDD